MKMVFLMYLEEDDGAVLQLLETQGVANWSRMSLEGHGLGSAGWYGDVAPYRSRLVFSAMPEEKADRLLRAIEECDRCQDPAHPIHAMQVDIERSVQSGTGPNSN